MLKQHLPVEVVKESQVGQKGTGQKRVSRSGGYLLLELLLTDLPPVLFTLQVQQQVLGTSHFVLDCLHFIFDVGEVADQHFVVLFVSVDVMFQLDQVLLQLVVLLLHYFLLGL